MSDISKTLSLVLLPLLAVSCMEEAPTSFIVAESETPAGVESTSASLGLDAQLMILRGNVGWNESETTLTKSPAEDGFFGPLFGLATAPNNHVLVADAGAGVTTVHGGTPRNLIPLPGITDMSSIGHRSVWATTGAGEDPESDTGQGIHRLSRDRRVKIANLFAYEAAYNPDGAEVDSNPFDVEALGDHAALVADAGGNDLLRVGSNGNVELLAVFPTELVSTDNIKDLVGCPNPSDLCSLPPMIPAQAVPTSVAVGLDGYYYVGELKGFPAPAGASNVWRVSPHADGAMCGSSPDCVKVFDGGFTSIIDLVFDAQGNLLVAELDERSWFAVEAFGGSADAGTINRCDVGSGTCAVVASGIPILTALTVDHDGSVYATENALIPPLAAVIKVD